MTSGSQIAGETQKPRIFLADDHPVVVSGLETMLGAGGRFEICGGWHSADGIHEEIVRCRPELIILDFLLPPAGGFKLIREVARRHPQLKIVIFSMHFDQALTRSAIKSGAHAFVCKSDPPERLIAVIEGVLAGDHQGHHHGGGDGHHEWMGLEKSTRRELAIYELLGEGLKTREIAARLFISVKTVETHRENIKSKLGLASSEQIIASSARRSAWLHGVLSRS